MLIQSVVRARGAFRLSPTNPSALRWPSGSTNQMNAIHRAKTISVPPIITTLLPARLPAMRVLHAASRGARRPNSVQLSGRRNEVPAGEKPSGLPAGLQETSAKTRPLGFLRSPDHKAQLGLRPRKSSETDCRTLKRDGSRNLGRSWSPRASGNSRARATRSLCFDPLTAVME
jgi:hypothetical protein